MQSKNKQAKVEKEYQPKDFLLVGIGASAGGLSCGAENGRENGGHGKGGGVVNSLYVWRIQTTAGKTQVGKLVISKG